MLTWKIVSDGADVVSSGRVFQTRGPATEKTLLPTKSSETYCTWPHWRMWHIGGV